MTRRTFAIAARLPPTALARALRSTSPATGTTATVSNPSMSVTSVLNTRSGAMPRVPATAAP